MISYNVLTVPDTAAFEKHINALKPRWLLFKDNLAYAAQIGANNPTVAIMHRDYATYQGDDDLPHRITPAAWLSTQRALGFLDVWRYCCNESGFTENTLAWVNEVVEINAKHPLPLRLVVGNWSAGTPQPDDWKQPQAVKLLRYLNQYRAWLVLGLHEYFAGVATSGFYGGYPNHAGVDPNGADRDKGQDLIPMAKWPADTSKITLWHCGRFRFILKTCDELGIPYPRIVITETGADNLDDIKPFLETLQKTPPYTSIRGWRSLERQWGAWYSVGLDAVYYNMLTYLDTEVYIGSPVEAQLIFSWGDSGGWEQFRVDNAPEFQRRLEMYADASPTPPPFDYGTLEPRRLEFTGLKLIDYINLRAAPSDSSAILAHIGNNSDVLISPNAQTVNDFAWYKVTFAGKSGYIAETGNFKVIPIPEPPNNELDKAALLALVDDAIGDTVDALHMMDDVLVTLKQIKDALK